MSRFANPAFAELQLVPPVVVLKTPAAVGCKRQLGGM
jgi:hypothetical protein